MDERYQFQAVRLNDQFLETGKTFVGNRTAMSGWFNTMHLHNDEELMLVHVPSIYQQTQQKKFCISSIKNPILCLVSKPDVFRLTYAWGRGRRSYIDDV